MFDLQATNKYLQAYILYTKSMRLDFWYVDDSSLKCDVYLFFTYTICIYYVVFYCVFFTCFKTLKSIYLVYFTDFGFFAIIVSVV